MNKVKLTKVAPHSGNRVVSFDGIKKYLSTGDLKDDGLSFEDVTFSSKPSRADIIVNEGDILFARMANTDKILQIDKNLSGSIVSTGFSVHRPDEKHLDAKYLIQILKNDVFRIQKNKYCTGSTQSAITNTGIEKIVIPLPSLSEQIKIARILNQAEALISQRKQSISLLEELLKSTFSRLFGDPNKNSKMWPTKRVDQVADVLTGFAFKSEDYSSNKNDVKICGGLIIYPGWIDWEKSNYWSNEKTDGLEKYWLEGGDIIMALDRPWISSGFKLAMIKESDPKSLLIQRTARIKSININNHYLHYLFLHKAFEIHCKPTETTVPHISPKEIKSFKVPIPPSDLQTKFGDFVEKGEIIKSQYIESLKELENMYAVLCQKAFKGELI